MPLNRLVQLQCDNCGSCNYSEPPLPHANDYFESLGYIRVGRRWYCDNKCRDNHRVKLQELRKNKW